MPIWLLLALAGGAAAGRGITGAIGRDKARGAQQDALRNLLEGYDTKVGPIRDKIDALLGERRSERKGLMSDRVADYESKRTERAAEVRKARQSKEKIARQQRIDALVENLANVAQAERNRGSNLQEQMRAMQFEGYRPGRKSEEASWRSLPTGLAQYDVDEKHFDLDEKRYQLDELDYQYRQRALADMIGDEKAKLNAQRAIDEIEGSRNLGGDILGSVFGAGESIFTDWYRDKRKERDKERARGF